MPRTEKRQDRPSRRRGERSKTVFGLGFWTGLLIVILLAGFVMLVVSSRPQVTGKELVYTRFVELAETGRIESAKILDADSYVVGRYRDKNGTSVKFNVPYLQTADARQTLLDLLVENDIEAPIDQQFGKSLVDPGVALLPALMIVIIIGYVYMSLRFGTGPLGGVRSGARKFKGSERRETFADVAGQDDAVASLRDLADALSNPERFSQLGARLPRGLLLYGPPGCGKTLLARAFAGETGAAFFSISGSDFVEMYLGVGAARVRDLFNEAREDAPSVIFIDEIDAVGRSRGASNGEQEQALNQILTEMDGFSQSEGVIVLAATNRPDVLDPALLRPGRFDRSVGLDRPSEDGRLAILTVHAKTRVLDPSVDLRQVAKRAYGLTGADLANVVNEAALLAGQANKTALTQAELDQALERVLQAPESQRRLALRQRSIGKRAEGLDDRVTFADLAGVDDAIADLNEVRDFLIEPERFAEVGAVIPRGILLFGPPGCGKSLLAKAMAGEAHGAFFSVSATEFIGGGGIGSGAARVRDLFAEAKAVAPAIVFIDEIDAIGGRRAIGGDSNGAADSAQRDQEQTFTQILIELDGFEPRTGVIVMAATNRPDVLDPALMRPGRFDRQVPISLPDRDGRRAILELHAHSRQLEPGLDLDSVAEHTHGMTGADLANVVNEAALQAARAHKPALSQANFDDAVKRLLEAPERQRRLSMRQRSVGKRATGMDERVTFADVAGVDDAIAELAELRDYLAEPERFAEMGVHMPRGILLDGPPGVGKTMLAKAVAGEANAAFFSVSGTDFVQRWVGLGAARVRDLFAEAKAVAPAIVFIDEIDALGGARGDTADSDSGRREQDHALNQLLTELDGFDPRTGVIVMAATNRPDMLDPALLRPGRFDRQIGISPPDRAGRKAILELYVRDKPVAADVDLDAVAGLTSGFSGAELANLVNEAGLLATRARQTEITAAVLEEAVERVLVGVSSRRHVMTEEERRITAYHEAGHALVGLTLPGVSVPRKVTIVPRGRTGGYVWTVDEDDRAIHSRSVLINQMAMGFGGRAAEELIFGEPGSGAADDLAKVSALARRMVRELGMSEALGGVTYSENLDGGPGSGRQAYSDAENRLIGEEVRRLIDEAHGRARRVLTDSRDALERIAEALLERETLTAEDLKALTGPGAPLAAA